MPVSTSFQVAKILEDTFGQSGDRILFSHIANVGLEFEMTRVN